MCLGLDHMTVGRRRIVGWEEEEEEKEEEARFEYAYRMPEEGCLVVWDVCRGGAERVGPTEDRRYRRLAKLRDGVWRCLYSRLVLRELRF